MTFKQCTATVLLASSFLLVAPATGKAATLSTSTVTISTGDVSISSSNTKVSGDNVIFAQVLSSSYNRSVPVKEIIRLRADLNFGLGDISLIYAAAVYSGRPIDEISQLRQKNMGWGEIAKLYGVKVKDLKQGNYKVVSAAREQGVDVTYIEIEDNSHEHHRGTENKDSGPSDKGNPKKDNKHDNGKGNGHNK